MWTLLSAWDGYVYACVYPLACLGCKGGGLPFCVHDVSAIIFPDCLFHSWHGAQEVEELVQVAQMNRHDKPVPVYMEWEVAEV